VEFILVKVQMKHRLPDVCRTKISSKIQ